MAAIGFHEIEVGRRYTTNRRTITDADIAGFAGLSGDFNPLHMDDVFAAEETPYGRRIAHGLLGVAIGSGMRSEVDDWYVIGFLEVRRRFEGPIFVGDTVRTEYEVTGVRQSKSSDDRGVVTLGVQLVKQDDTVVQSGEDIVLVGTPSTEGES